MGCSWSCRRKRVTLNVKLLQLDQQQRREALEAMRVRQTAEEDELIEQFGGQPESWSWLSRRELQMLYDLRDRHLAEEREILGHISIDIRHRRHRR